MKIQEFSENFRLFETLRVYPKIPQLKRRFPNQNEDSRTKMKIFGLKRRFPNQNEDSRTKTKFSNFCRR